ncbi:MAG: hypothetical protein ACRDCN_00235 [Tannerellaceae bacterium]
MKQKMKYVIRTHPAGEDYIFVESINKVANVKYKHAWYYKNKIQ